MNTWREMGIAASMLAEVWDQLLYDETCRGEEKANTIIPEDS